MPQGSELAQLPGLKKRFVVSRCQISNGTEGDDECLLSLVECKIMTGMGLCRTRCIAAWQDAS